MKKTFFLLFLLTVVVSFVPAQSGDDPNQLLEIRPVPQWAKDLRRWEIVMFGSFPFAMFTTTIIMDAILWKDANRFDFSEQGRRYAPWPLKSSGAIALGDKAQVRTIGFAVGLSAAVAFADLIIVQTKRQRARKKAEALPVGTTIIIRSPWPDEPEAEETESQETEVQEQESPES